MQPADSDERTAAIARGTQFMVDVDGSAISAYEGETVLGVLWAAGVRTLRRTPSKNEARGRRPTVTPTT